MMIEELEQRGDREYVFLESVQLERIRYYCDF